MILLSAFWILRSLGLLHMRTGPLSWANETLESFGLLLLGTITLVSRVGSFRDTGTRLTVTLPFV